MSDAAKLIFFSHSRIMFHVFFLFFSAAIRHIAQSGIYFRRIIPAWLLPASHNQSSCLPQSILLPPTINPTASHNQSSYLPPSILLPPTINPTASHHQSYSLQQSILQPSTINPTVSRHILSPFIIWLSFIMCRYLSCRHPHPDDYLFSYVCPTQHESPSCQYGSGIRQ